MGIFERAKRIVSVEEYKKSGIPLFIKKFKLECPYENQYILRMPLMVNGVDVYIPNELKWIQDIIESSINHQLENIKVAHSFCYVTIRHGIVSSQTDDEWHVDGFSTKITHIPEQNYIICDNNPTEYVNLNVDFPSDFNPIIHNVNLFLSKRVQEKMVFQCKENSLYCLDPYILHRRPKGTNNIKRTFVRVSFVPIEINDINNAQNPLLKRIYTENGVLFRNKLIDY